MDITDIGTIIATRVLTLAATKTVTISIGTPTAYPDGNDFYCPYQIVGIGSGQIRYASGVDSFQALYLAMKKIGADINTSSEAKSGDLTWLGNRDLGFPVPLGFSVPPS